MNKITVKNVNDLKEESASSFILRQISYLLSGDKESLSLENRIFISSSLITAFTGLVSIIWNIYIGISFVINSVIAASIIVYGVLYYYSRFKKRFNSFVYILTSLSFLSILWVTCGGLQSCLPALYIIALMIFITITNTKYHIIIFFITLLSFIMMIALEKSSLFTDLIAKATNMELMEKDLQFGYLVLLLVSFMLISFFKKKYDKENVKLLYQKKELQKLNASKDLMFNIIAHDLRDPFNSIIGFAELMTVPSSNLTLEEIREYARQTKRSSKNTLELLDSLLDWGRAQQDKIHLEPQTIALKSVVDNCVLLFSEKYIKKEIEVDIKVPDVVNVFADLHVLQTILRNLLSNAIKFTPIGGKICILAEEYNDDKVIVAVEDTGIGMNEELINNLFCADVNTNRKGTDGEHSIGLGLIICKELVEKQGGEIMVESEVNGGSIFKFTVHKL